MENKEGYKETAIGWMPEDWDIKRVDEIADVFLSNVDKKSNSKEVDVLLCNYMDVFQNNYITSSMDFMKATATPNEIEKFSLKKDDVLLTKDSETQEDIAQPAVVSEKLEGVLCGYHLAILRPKQDQIAGRFLMNTINSPAVHNYFVKLTNGVTRFGLNKLSINGAIVPLPPLPEQTKIADILTTVDDKISSIDSQIQQTEQLKKGLMEKLLTEGIGHTEFKETEIGRIPVGWKVIELGKISTIVRGASPRPKGDPRYYGGNVPRLMGQDVTRDGKIVFPKIDFLTEEGAQKSRFMPKGSLILTCSGTVGIPTILGIDACVHDGFIAFSKVSDLYSIDYLFYTFASLQTRFNSSATHGGVFTNLTTKSIKDFLISSPPLQEQKQIATILSTVDDKLDILTQKKSNYQTLKKGLSQQLLTGQMRVKV